MPLVREAKHRDERDVGGEFAPALALEQAIHGGFRHRLADWLLQRRPHGADFGDLALLGEGSKSGEPLSFFGYRQQFPMSPATFTHSQGGFACAQVLGVEMMDCANTTA
jgi:hypothetical protein